MPVIPQSTGVHARSRRRLSASSLVTWERCKRDWFLTRRLGIRVATHPEMLLGHIVEEAVTSIWMERAHPTEGMPQGASTWAPGHDGDMMPIDSLETLKGWLRTLMRPIVDRMMEEMNAAWSACLWKAEGRAAEDVKREKMNAMIKNAIKLQIAEAQALSLIHI